jgi:multidrug efflux pump subunit AcrA (membrane-fusion protein)
MPEPLAGLFGGGASETAATKISTSAVTMGDLIVGLVADGSVALPVSSLNFEVSGTIKKIYVETGDLVEVGDLLAELDDSDYQYEISTAQNNVDKAQTAYDSALSQLEYSGMSDQATLSSLKKEAEAAFDAYTYDVAIEDAQTTLSRRQQELADALEAADDPLDSYTVDQAVKTAEQNVADKEEALAEAQAALDEVFDDYSYQNTIKEAEISLERKQAALTKAQAELKEARANAPEPFDDYTYQTQIADAQLNLNRKNEALVDAQNARDKVEDQTVASAAAFDPAPYQKKIEEAQAELAAARKAEEAAKAAYDAAQGASSGSGSGSGEGSGAGEGEGDGSGAASGGGSLAELEAAYKAAVARTTAALTAAASANTALVDAEAQWQDDLDDLVDSKTSDSDAKVTSAYQAVEDAAKSLAKAKTDLERAQAAYEESLDDSTKSAIEAAEDKVESAQQAVDDAQRSLEKARTDRERALESGASDEADAVKTAQRALDDANAALEKAVVERDRAYEQAEDSAGDQVKSARQAVTDAETALEKARTNKSRAQADYAEQKADAQEKYELQAMSVEINEKYNTSVSNAQFELQEAKLALEEAEGALSDTRLVATTAGEILSVSQTEGAQVTAQVNTGAFMFGTGGGGMGFITLRDVSAIYLTAGVTEGDIVSIEVGMVIRVTIDALEGEEFTGKVTYIDSIPTTDTSGITTYQVTCALDEVNGQIRDGMAALITFVQRANDDVLLVPNKAVFLEDGLQYVYVVPDGQAADAQALANAKGAAAFEKRKVVCGLSNGTQSEVTEGLSAGEVVVVGKLTAS